MKYLHDDRLAEITSFLSDCLLGKEGLVAAAAGTSSSASHHHGMSSWSSSSMIQRMSGTTGGSSSSSSTASRMNTSVRASGATSSTTSTSASSISGGTTSQRVLNGRLEAYTMKRTADEKKYATKIGKSYMELQESNESSTTTSTTMHTTTTKTSVTTTTNAAAQSASFMMAPNRIGVLLPPTIAGSYHGTLSSSTTSGNGGGKRKKQQQAVVGQTTRKRCYSTGAYEESIGITAVPTTGSSNTTSTRKNPKRNTLMEQQKQQRRVRSCSYDVTASRSYATTALGTTTTNHSQPWIGPSSFGSDFHQGGGIGIRRLMMDFILTLNMSFPDFDFSAVRPIDFITLSVQETIQKINPLLSDIAIQKRGNESFLLELWNALDAVIQLQDCEVYSYQPSKSSQDNDDPMQFLTSLISSNKGNDELHDHHHTPIHHRHHEQQQHNHVLWSFNYFFVNKTLKRIVLFTCIECLMGPSTMVAGSDGEDDNEQIIVHEDEDDHVDDTYSSRGRRRHEHMGTIGNRFSNSSRRRTNHDHLDDDEEDDDDYYDDDVVQLVTDTNEVEYDFDLDPASTTAGGIPISSIGM